MNKLCTLLGAVFLLPACSPPDASTELTTDSTTASRALNSGIDRDGMDFSVRPQDDFFAYANGTWVKETTIPADQSGWGSFNILRDTGLSQLRTIIQDVADSSDDAKAAKIGDYYNAYLNIDRVSQLISVDLCLPTHLLKLKTPHIQ